MTKQMHKSAHNSSGFHVIHVLVGKESHKRGAWKKLDKSELEGNKERKLFPSKNKKQFE